MFGAGTLEHVQHIPDATRLPRALSSFILKRSTIVMHPHAPSMPSTCLQAHSQRPRPQRSQRTLKCVLNTLSNVSLRASLSPSPCMSLTPRASLSPPHRASLAAGPSLLHATMSLALRAPLAPCMSSAPCALLAPPLPHCWPLVCCWLLASPLTHHLPLMYRLHFACHWPLVHCWPSRIAGLL